MYRGEVMNRKDLLRLREVRDSFRELSDEYYSYIVTEDIELRAFYRGKSNAYAFAADKIDRLINICEKDISKE